MPQGIKQAITAIWVTIFLSVIAALVNSWLGQISIGEFVWYIIIYSLYCLFPYKLAKGSNPARWVYTILFAGSTLIMLGSGVFVLSMPIADLVVSVIIFPIEIFIIFRLFQSSASEWFTQSQS